MLWTGSYRPSVKHMRGQVYLNPNHQSYNKLREAFGNSVISSLLWICLWKPSGSAQPASIVNMCSWAHMCHHGMMITGSRPAPAAICATCGAAPVGWPLCTDPIYTRAFMPTPANGRRSAYARQHPNAWRHRVRCPTAANSTPLPATTPLTSAGRRLTPDPLDGASQSNEPTHVTNHSAHKGSIGFLAPVPIHRLCPSPRHIHSLHG